MTLLLFILLVLLAVESLPVTEEKVRVLLYSATVTGKQYRATDDAFNANDLELPCIILVCLLLCYFDQ